MTRIALVGGYPYERDLVTEWLGEVPGVRAVIAVVADDAVRSRTPAVDLLVAIVDDDGAGCRPLETSPRSALLGDGGGTVAVLRGSTPGLIERCVGAGADALVSLASGPRALCRAAVAVREGGAWLDPALSPAVMEQLGRVPWDAVGFGLTPREFEVARRFPDGLSRREIATELAVTEETVKTHIRSIYTKLGVNDRTAAARRIQRCLGGSSQPDGVPG